jgi:hypothetical protein
MVTLLIILRYFVRRYFGLAAMEVTKNEPSADDTTQTSIEDSSNEVGQNTAIERQESDTSTREECLDFNEQEDADFQESGYVSSSQTTENSSPPDAATNSPPQHDHTPPLSASNFPPLPKFPTTPTSRTHTKRKMMKKKSITSQMSLDMFAFKKDRVTTEDSESEGNASSPKRTVLADRSPPNCEMDEEFNERPEDEIGDEDKKENFNSLLKRSQSEVEDASLITQEKSLRESEKPDNASAKTQSKLLGR